MEELPSLVDGDGLYHSDVGIIELLKVPIDFKRYELRYISTAIGFGVFSKETINKGEIISFYSGVKKAQNSTQHYEPI